MKRETRISAHTKIIKRARHNGVGTAFFNCPHCGVLGEMICASDNEQWNKTAPCLNCGKLLIRTVENGAVTIEKFSITRIVNH